MRRLVVLALDLGPKRPSSRLDDQLAHWNCARSLQVLWNRTTIVERSVHMQPACPSHLRNSLSPVVHTELGEASLDVRCHGV